MKRRPHFIAVPLLTLVFLCAPAFAQSQSSQPAKPASSSATSKTSTTVEDVKNWTSKQWNAATREWAKDKQKWADCRKQSKEKKLSGKDSWSFLYSCMTA